MDILHQEKVAQIGSAYYNLGCHRFHPDYTYHIAIVVYFNIYKKFTTIFGFLILVHQCIADVSVLWKISKLIFFKTEITKILCVVRWSNFPFFYP